MFCGFILASTTGVLIVGLVNIFVCHYNYCSYCIVYPLAPNDNIVPPFSPIDLPDPPPHCMLLYQGPMME